MESLYTFRSIPSSDLTSPMGGLDIPSLEKLLSQGNRLGEYMASFRGALLQLFGEPAESSAWSSEAYLYVIEASDKQGETWPLMIVQGSFGPSILGDPSDEAVYSVAEDLLRLIENTSPADFEAVIYDEDSNTTVTYGCSGGRCYSRDVPGQHISP